MPPYKTHMKLTIFSVTQADYGMYKCVAKNPRGETDGTIRVYGKWVLCVCMCEQDMSPNVITQTHQPLFLFESLALTSNRTKSSPLSQFNSERHTTTFMFNLKAKIRSEGGRRECWCFGAARSIASWGFGCCSRLTQVKHEKLRANKLTATQHKDVRHTKKHERSDTHALHLHLKGITSYEV